MLLDYIASLLRPFFRWWWAVVSGIVSLLSFFAWENSGLVLSGTQVALGALLLSTCIFLTAAVVSEGFEWYRRAYRHPDVVSFSLSESPGDEVFRVSSRLPLEPGQVISLLRTIDDRIVCIGILKVDRMVATNYQCVPLWLRAGHRSDLKQKLIHVGQLSASLLVNESDLQQYRKEVS